MQITTHRETFILFIGDILSFFLALWLTLAIRLLSWPSWELYQTLLTPFVLIFAVWVIVFFISDLYGKQTTLFQRRLPLIIFNAQLVNTLLATVFFYFIPYFGVTPKTTLFIDLVLSFGLVALWRRYLVRFVSRGRRETILFLCEGKEIDELIKEFKDNPKFNLTVIPYRPGEAIENTGASVIVTNAYDRSIDDALEEYYRLIFSRIRFVSAHSLYEEVFDRVPIGIINERWFLENISNRPKPYYDFLKRVFDIVVAFSLGLVSLVVYPLCWLLIKFDDWGQLFSYQERVGRNGKLIKVIKFRTMTLANDGGHWTTTVNRVTRVGNFLRRSRIDELPQLWNIVWGDLSLIGPRPEFEEAVKLYEREIPFYPIRHLIKPGLSGWAQMYQENHPHHAAAIDLTREKLSYDLYYIKNRSFWLDLKIALKTINILVRRTGA